MNLVLRSGIFCLFYFFFKKLCSQLSHPYADHNSNILKTLQPTTVMFVETTRAVLKINKEKILL